MDQPHNVESGIRRDLHLGDREPASGLEWLAVVLARSIDAGQDEKLLAALSRELRLTMEQLQIRPPRARDWLDDIGASAEGKRN